MGWAGAGRHRAAWSQGKAQGCWHPKAGAWLRAGWEAGGSPCVRVPRAPIMCSVGMVTQVMPPKRKRAGRTSANHVYKQGASLHLVLPPVLLL